MDSRLIALFLLLSSAAWTQMTPVQCPTTAPAKTACYTMGSNSVYLYPQTGMKFTCAAVKPGKPALGVLCTSAKVGVTETDQKRSFWAKLFGRN